MKKNDEMIKAILYEDGTWEIEDIDSSYTTQKLYCAYNGRFGTLYICEKEKAHYYLKELFKESIEETNVKIRELIAKRDALSAQLHSFEEIMKGDTK